VPELGAALGERLGARFVMANWTIDTIVPVPLHAMRLKERGYNQSQILSENMAQRLGLSCTPEALRREKYSQSQVGLSAVERKKNVEDAFSATPQLVEHRKILLVDDVCTTGSTLSVCAQALRAAGASQVYALTVTAAHG
jgi:ComF family protein